MSNCNFTKELFSLQDLKYRDFHAKLIPTVEKERIIGVRMPQLRKLAKGIAKENPRGAKCFMQTLPHYYYEENNLHGFFIGELYKTPIEVLTKLDEFLPYVDNWASCDSLAPKILKQDIPLLRSYIEKWIGLGAEEKTYTQRFAIVCMLQFLLDEAFVKNDLYDLAQIKSEEYYVNMALAWYYSFALIKQYDNTIKIIENRILNPWVHNKAIQKAIESYRVTSDRKDYLRSLKVAV